MNRFEPEPTNTNTNPFEKVTHPEVIYNQIEDAHARIGQIYDLMKHLAMEKAAFCRELNIPCESSEIPPESQALIDSEKKFINMAKQKLEELKREQPKKEELHPDNLSREILMRDFTWIINNIKEFDKRYGKGNEFSIKEQKKADAIMEEMDRMDQKDTEASR